MKKIFLSISAAIIFSVGMAFSGINLSDDATSKSCDKSEECVCEVCKPGCERECCTLK